MITVQKFKFGHRFETLETNNLDTVKKALEDYRYCDGDLYLSTKFVGEYATCIEQHEDINNRLA